MGSCYSVFESSELGIDLKKQYSNMKHPNPSVTEKTTHDKFLFNVFFYSSRSSYSDCLTKIFSQNSSSNCAKNVKAKCFVILRFFYRVSQTCGIIIMSVFCRTASFHSAGEFFEYFVRINHV